MEHRIRFVENEHCVGRASFGEQGGDVLLGIADPLGDQLGVTDYEDLAVQGTGDRLGGHRLPGTRGPGEEDGALPRVAMAFAETPVAQNEVPVRHVVDDMPHLVIDGGGKDDV